MEKLSTYHNVKAFCSWSECPNAFWCEQGERSPGFCVLIFPLIVECGATNIHLLGIVYPPVPIEIVVTCAVSQSKVIV